MNDRLLIWLVVAGALTVYVLYLALGFLYEIRELSAPERAALRLVRPVSPRSDEP